MKIHFLTNGEESAIKSNIPWAKIDPEIRDLVKFANEISGIATLQSCAGHVYQDDNSGFHIEPACIVFKANKKWTEQTIFHIAPKYGIRDVSLRYFNDGSFWIDIGVDPAEHWRLWNFFKYMKEDA